MKFVMGGVPRPGQWSGPIGPRPIRAVPIRAGGPGEVGREGEVCSARCGTHARYWTCPLCPTTTWFLAFPFTLPSSPCHNWSLLTRGRVRACQPGEEWRERPENLQAGGRVHGRLAASSEEVAGPGLHPPQFPIPTPPEGVERGGYGRRPSVEGTDARCQCHHQHPQHGSLTPPLLLS